MNAQQIRLFREKLKDDKKNLTIRRKLHENYEWLEAYWQNKYTGNNHIDKFCTEFETYFWGIKDIREVAREFAFNPPVGNSKNNFEPTISLQRATYHLRYFSKLIEEEFPDTSNEKEIGRKWNKSPFNALLIIVKQIRDNLFHGRKMELSEPQYSRNKELITMAARVTDIVLENLENAENDQKLCTTLCISNGGQSAINETL